MLTDDHHYKVWCETCDWEKEVDTIEEWQLAAQEHQDEEHGGGEVTFSHYGEWLQ